MTVLKLEGISAGYADSDVIHGVDLAVEPGDFTCLLGSNNAGKSTLINCISGLVPARGGRVHFNDADITRMAPYQRAREGLIQVPEGRQLFSEMTVHENILLRSEEHTSELQSLMRISYAVFCLKKKTN